MVIGVPGERKEQEYRVALTPAGAGILSRNGHTVLIERNAGLGSGISDNEYREKGAIIVTSPEEIYKRADMIVKVKEPIEDEYPLLQDGQIVFTFLHLAANRNLTEVLIDKGIIGIAYESVQLDNGTLPILHPMSEIAGRMAPIVGTHHLQENFGGSGILISGIPGVAPGRVTILGGGTVGQNAARIASALGATVVILDRDLWKLKYIDDMFSGRIITLPSNEHNIEEELSRSDLVIGAVLIPGARTPCLVRKVHLSIMRKGTVIVDVSIDQGGCVETSRPTTHNDPVFEMEGVIHYCVVNMPGAYPRTSTFALCNTTLPYILELANKGWKKAIQDDTSLARGITVMEGKVTNQEVARAFGMEFEPPF